MTAAEIRALIGDLVAELRAAPFTVAPVRAVRRGFSKRIKVLPARDVVALADLLLEVDVPAARFVAYELVEHHEGAAKSLRARDLERFARALASWESVDTFSCYLAGPAWRAGQISDAFIARLASSKDRWRRRAALVATVPLVRGKDAPRGAASRTLALCNQLIDDRDDMVVKAMSWSLRELSKNDPAAVRRFLSARGDRVAARVRREVRNKLTTGLKNPKRASAR